MKVGIIAPTSHPRSLGVMLVYLVLYSWGGDDSGWDFPGYFFQMLSCGLTQVLRDYLVIYGFLKLQYSLFL